MSNHKTKSQTVWNRNEKILYIKKEKKEEKNSVNPT